jgi:hypothetical protein
MVLRRVRRSGLIALAGTGLMVGAALLPAHAATTAPTPGWRVVKTYPASSLNDIAATAANDAFVIGDGNLSGSAPFILNRWNGSRWLTLPQLPVAKGFHREQENPLLVAASSADNAWVFATVSNKSPDRPLVQRWNGRRWVSQSLFPAFAEITGAVTFGRSDAWAFGQWPTGPAFAAHYDGRKWVRESFPIAADVVSALSGSDIWVLGQPPSDGVPEQGSVVEHYAKGAWHKLVPPFARQKGQSVEWSSMVADSDTNVWAVAVVVTHGFEDAHDVLLHYNGSSWKRVGLPYPVGSGMPYPVGQYTLAQDGSGGFWLSTIECVKTACASYFYHHARDGKWTSAQKITLDGRSAMGPPVWIPGTTSLWSIGTEGLNIGSSAPQGFVLKYGE